MPVSLDLNLLPIIRRENQDQTDFPGLYAVTPPRRTTRGRNQDNLILYLSLVGSTQASSDYQLELLTKLAQKYYKTAGTVTSALRALAEMLNQILLERNLRSPGAQLIGYLTQIVLRGDVVTLAHSGPCYAFHMTPAEVNEVADVATSGRGLGFSRSASLRYFQQTIQPNEFLLLTHQPAHDWQLDGLRISSNQGIEGLRRRLLIGRTEPNLNAVLIQSVSGSGKLRFLRLKRNLPEMARPQAESPTSEPQEQVPLAAITPQDTPQEEINLQEEQALPRTSAAETGGVVQEAPVGDDLVEQRESEPSPEPEEIQVDMPLVQIESPVQESVAKADEQTVQPDQADVGEDQKIHPAESQAESQSEAVPVQATAQYSRRAEKPSPVQTPKKRSIQFNGLRRFASILLSALAVVQQAFASTARQAGKAAFVLLGRLLPDESMLRISTRTLVFIAVAVPLLVGVVGVMVYIERGQSAQYQELYDQALQISADAFTKTDPIEQRLAYQTTMDLLGKAEIYRITPESQALRAMVLESLDILDGIERLDFQPALNSGLDRTTNITKLVVNGGDLYMLNGTQGSVIRAVLTGGAYQLDPQFICGPIAGGSAVVGPLVDIVPLARGDETKATLMGVDASGTLIFCVPGDQPLIQPVIPPGTNFDSVRAFDWNANTLYLLDPGSNAVWFYESRNIAVPPRFFFGEDIPYMQDVIDLAVSNRDLYLLHADGHQSFCVYQIEATRCQDPFEYADLREGRTGGPVIPDALFTQIQFAPPPDPSLFLLEPKAQSIYHFSLRLVLQRQYQPLQPLGDEPVTAFAVSPTRTAFLALGSQVYFAQLP